jgi:hypothetical protein
MRVAARHLLVSPTETVSGKYRTSPSVWKLKGWCRVGLPPGHVLLRLCQISASTAWNNLADC